jgi:Lhr-like helicase
MKEIEETAKFLKNIDFPQQIQILSESAEAEMTLEQIELNISYAYEDYDTNAKNVYNKIAPKLGKTLE